MTKQKKPSGALSKDALYLLMEQGHQPIYFVPLTRKKIRYSMVESVIHKSNYTVESIVRNINDWYEDYYFFTNFFLAWACRLRLERGQCDET